MHVALFAHGLLAHSSMSVLQFSPVQPFEQLQL
jgi:hypothetical protein